MAGKREKPEEIVSKLRQVEVLQGQGATVAESTKLSGILSAWNFWHIIAELDASSFLAVNALTSMIILRRNFSVVLNRENKDAHFSGMTQTLFLRMG